jgi:predicted neuraminidase
MISHKAVQRSLFTSRVQPLLLAALLIPSVGQAEVREEFVFESPPFASCHASTLVETQNGDLLAAWFGGSAEGNPDVASWMSRSSRNAWSEPLRLISEPGAATYNPVLFRTSDNLLWLSYKFGLSPTNGTGAYLNSSSDGQTW